jgi:hypothetical protein
MRTAGAALLLAAAAALLVALAVPARHAGVAALGRCYGRAYGPDEHVGAGA